MWAATHGAARAARSAPNTKMVHRQKLVTHNSAGSLRSQGAPAMAASTKAPIPMNANRIAFPPMGAPSPKPARDGRRRLRYHSALNEGRDRVE